MLSQDQRVNPSLTYYTLVSFEVVHDKLKPKLWRDNIPVIKCMKAENDDQHEMISKRVLNKIQFLHLHILQYWYTHAGIALRRKTGDI